MPISDSAQQPLQQGRDESQNRLHRGPQPGHSTQSEPAQHRAKLGPQRACSGRQRASSRLEGTQTSETQA